MADHVPNHQPHERSPSATKGTISSDHDEEDPYDARIRRSGCKMQHEALQNCYIDHHDWRKCREEMKKFRECMSQLQQREHS
ncbi:hypothetical protein BC832DRAFT_362378 [Gaertneriomyces semiglobifer]|nr:hypothetical protein BC832DRAFT_362378 [Gaertneriomyces semiglobifer]